MLDLMPTRAVPVPTQRAEARISAPVRSTELPKQYETARARVAAMYQIPLATRDPRILELHVSPQRRIVDADWQAKRIVGCRLGRQAGKASRGTGCADSIAESTVGVDDDLPFPSASFDLVILHYTLDELAAMSDGRPSPAMAVQLLRRVMAVLDKGGVVAGCTGNASILHRFLRRQRPLMSRGRPGIPVFSPAACSRALERAGLSDSAVFSVLPMSDGPRSLVSIDARASRRVFRQQLAVNRDGFGVTGYLVRRLMMELALNRHVEPDLFYFGYRAC